MTPPADGRGGGTPPRPPAAKPQQWFTLRPWTFDVTLAGCCAPRRAPPSCCPSSRGHAATGCSPPPGGSPHTVPLSAPARTSARSTRWAPTWTSPLIIASVTTDGTGPPCPLLIDGCHRLYKAARLSREQLPSLVLTGAETLAIRRDALLGPPRRAGGAEDRP